jgi:hypothetical protein
MGSCLYVSSNEGDTTKEPKTGSCLCVSSNTGGCDTTKEPKWGCVSMFQVIWDDEMESTV